MVSRGCAAANAATTSCWPSAGSAGASFHPAAQDAAAPHPDPRRAGPERQAALAGEAAGAARAGPRGRTASAGHECSSASSISTCTPARIAAPVSSRSSRASWSGRWIRMILTPRGGTISLRTGPDTGGGAALRGLSKARGKSQIATDCTANLLPGWRCRRPGRTLSAAGSTRRPRPELAFSAGQEPAGSARRDGVGPTAMQSGASQAGDGCVSGAAEGAREPLHSLRGRDGGLPGG